MSLFQHTTLKQWGETLYRTQIITQCLTTWEIHGFKKEKKSKELCEQWTMLNCINHSQTKLWGQENERKVKP